MTYRGADGRASVAFQNLNRIWVFEAGVSKPAIKYGTEAWNVAEDH